MRYTPALACACLLFAACTGGVRSDVQGAVFDAANPTGTYEFTTTSIDGQSLTGSLIVEGSPEAYRGRAIVSGMPPLELPTVRTGPDRLVLEGPDGAGGVLQVDMVFQGAEFTGHWEMLGQRSEVSGRVLSDRVDAPHASETIRFDTFEDLHGEIARRAREWIFSGVVLVAEGDEMLFHRAYGLRHRGDMRPRNVRPVERDTRFNIGSLDKLFTSVAILRLAQDGRLDLDAPVGTYLTAPQPDWGHRIPVRHLLQFSSGLGDYLRHPEFQKNPGRYRTVADLMELVRGEPLRFEPGEDQQYSNSGFVVLGAVIETVTGRAYHDVVREMVLVPAGMTATGPSPDAESATGYTRVDRGEAVSTEGHWTTLGGSPAGGGYSTAADLHRFVRALMTDRLLEPRYTDTFLRGFHGPTDEPLDRAGGWDVDWSGGAAGLNASLGFDAGTGRIVAVLANLDPPAAETLARSILRHGR